MSERLPAEQLAEKQYVTLLLRLLVDQEGQLVQGEVVTLQLQPLGRFTHWRELVRIIQVASKQ